MNFDSAIRLTEILMGFAFVQQSIEHLIVQTYERRLFLVRLILALLLIIGISTAWVSLLLLLVAALLLLRFQGPYNGGADRMSVLMLTCLCFTHFAPTLHLQELAFGYLALQLVLSYFMSGWVKIINPKWRNGIALRDVFQVSTYPVSEQLRSWALHPNRMLFMSWAVMLLELLFPFTLVSNISLIAALVIAAFFHFSNACLFGLNRFFWIWVAAYPSILWLQQRLFE